MALFLAAVQVRKKKLHSGCIPFPLSIEHPLYYPFVNVIGTVIEPEVDKTGFIVRQTTIPPFEHKKKNQWTLPFLHSTAPVVV